MNSKDLNKQFDALKRRMADLVAEMHARKLAIPAAALLAAIVAAMIVLPDKTTPPPPAPSTASDAPVVEQKVQQVAQISMIEPAKVGDDAPLASTSDPFAGGGTYSCEQVGSNPKVMECLVANISYRVVCPPTPAGPPCVSSGGGASGSAGSSGSSGETGSGTEGTAEGGTGGTTTPTEPETKYYALVSTIKLDDNEYKNVMPQTELPRGSTPLVAYINGDTKDRFATFLAAEGVTVSGVDMDPVFRAFALDVGQSATLTDAEGNHHKLTLKKVSYKEISSPK